MINTPGIGRRWSEKRKNRLLEFEANHFPFFLSSLRLRVRERYIHADAVAVAAGLSFHTYTV